MSNYCYNEVHASKEILDEIYDYNTKRVTFEKLLPIPKDVTNKYDWCLENWGVGGDAFECSGVPEDELLVFGTHWNAPFNVVEALCKKYPNSDLDWYYDAEGLDFVSHWYSAVDGSVIDKITPKRSYDEEEEDETEFEDFFEESEYEM